MDPIHIKKDYKILKDQTLDGLEKQVRDLMQSVQPDKKTCRAWASEKTFMNDITILEENGIKYFIKQMIYMEYSYYRPKKKKVAEAKPKKATKKK